jgi:hypothetical protein
MAPIESFEGISLAPVDLESLPNLNDSDQINCIESDHSTKNQNCVVRKNTTKGCIIVSKVDDRAGGSVE